MKSWCRVSAVFVGLLLVAGALSAAQSGTWIHVRVDEADGENVDLNLPLSAAQLVLDLVDLDAETSGTIEVNGREMEIAELRKIWMDIREADDGEIMRLKREGETVLISKQDDSLNVEVKPRGDHERVEAMVPIPVVDALFSGDEDTLDFSAAIRAMQHVPKGDVLRVKDGDTNVHVWID